MDSRSSAPDIPSAAPPRHNSKVAIPRLDQTQRRPPPSNKSTAAKVRTSKACDNCRKRKVKCTGGFPCRYCDEQSLNCTYQQGRRDRLRDATEHNIQLVSLLRDLSLSSVLGEYDQSRVDDLLGMVADDIDKTAKAIDKRPTTSDSHTPSEEPSGEAHVSGSIGSNEDADFIDGGLLDSHQLRATGLVGQDSNIEWLRKLKYHASVGTAKTSVTQSTFYLDGEDIEIDLEIDADIVPLPSTIELLLNAYKECMQNTFPILPRGFYLQMNRYIEVSKLGQSFILPRNVRAILNLVMAIGARYSHLIQAPWREDERDHFVYLTRAIKLLESHPHSSIMTSSPDFHLIQATGLLALYYVVIGHVSRGWIAIGISIRYALAVGMHLRNDDPSLSSSKRDALIRCWWSLHSIECLLSSITGRPSIISSEQCSAPLPSPQAGSRGPASSVPFQTHVETMVRPGSLLIPSMRPYSSFLEARTQIGLIMQKVQLLLYSPLIHTHSWERIERSITILTQDLNIWAQSTFPNGAVLRETYLLSFSDDEYLREHYKLAFLYYDTEILISRPCLCSLADRIQDQSTKSYDFNRQMGQYCIRAANDIAQLFPERPDPTWIYRNGPWWSIVHSIMQAATVFLLDLSNDSLHAKNTDYECVPLLKKLVLCLRAMRTTNNVANKAYSIILDMIKICAPRNDEIADLFKDDEDELQRFLDTPPRRLPPRAFETTQLQQEQGDTAQFNDPFQLNSPIIEQGFETSPTETMFSVPSHLSASASSSRQQAGRRTSANQMYGQQGQFVHFEPQQPPFEQMGRPPTSGLFRPYGIPPPSTQFNSSHPSLLSQEPSEQLASTEISSWESEYNTLYEPQFDTLMNDSWDVAYDQPIVGPLGMQPPRLQEQPGTLQDPNDPSIYLGVSEGSNQGQKRGRNG